MVVADLHVHTTNSDGAMTLAQVPEAARDAGVRVVAITDHDRVNPELDDPVSWRDGITVVNGIELRVESEAGRIDLLGYGVRPTPALCAETERIQANRVQRAQEICDCVEQTLGVELDIDIGPGIGRPHIARAIERSGADYDYQDAFDELIGDGDPCYVPRDIPDFETGVTLLADACGLVSLAHPLRYDDPEAALALCANDAIDAVEYHYDYGTETDARPVERATEEYGLVVTGGSDSHDHTLGRAGLCRDQYRAFRQAVRL